MGAVKRNTLSVLFIIKKSKLLKNGEAPVCMRITVNKRVAEVMIKRSILADLWNQKKECSKGKDRVATELNHYINTVRAKVLQIHRELEIDNKPITADTIKDCFYGRDKVQRSLLEVYAEHNEKCRALIGKEYTESTVTKFDTSINRLKEYAKCSESAQSHPKIDFFRRVQLENRNSCYICSRNPPNRACNSACWKPLKISVAVLKRVTG